MGLLYKRLVNGPIGENCYIVWDEATHEGAVIDPGYIEKEALMAILNDEDIKVKYVLNTHGHWDHMKHNQDVKEWTGNPLVYIHEDDEDYLTVPDLNFSAYFGKAIAGVAADKTFKEGDVFKLGAEILSVIHTPGHTPGGAIFLSDGLAFTGDTLFFGSIGRCDLPGGSTEAMENTLERLKTLIPGDARILPGHGAEVGIFSECMESNPFLTGQMKPK